MISDITKLNYTLFQLVKFNTETKKAKEVKVIHLAVKPSNIMYQYGTRAAITQTTGDKEVNGFKDSFGRSLTRVILRGTFGNRARLTGTEWKSGYTRLLEFREILFKFGNLQKGQTKRKIIGVNSAIYKTNPLNDNEVYVVNFYDFYNQEKFAVNFDQFQIIEDVSKNNLPSYTIMMTELGEIVTTGFDTADPTLAVLIDAEKVLGYCVNKVDGLMQNIGGYELLQGASKIKTSYDLALSTLGAGLQGTASLLNLFGDVGDVFTGKATMEKVSGFKAIFR